MRRLALIALLLIAAISAYALDVPPYSSPVTDLGRVLNDQQRQQLKQKILDYRTQSTNEIGVLIVNSLEGDAIEDYAHDVYAKWGIGKKGKDNGVLFVMSVTDRKARLEVGYGLEGELTDLESGRIVARNSPMASAFRANDYGRGVNAVVNGIIQAIGGEYDPQQRSNSDQDPSRFIVFIIIAIAVVVLRFIFGAFRGGIGGFRGPFGGGWTSGGLFGGGGSSGGGGGFSFGGGSSGGGGASGGW